jgi:hypothetical protein
MVIENSSLMSALGLLGLTLWPCVFLEKKALTNKSNPTIVLRHEAIHLEQQRECFIIPFYMIYIVELLCRKLFQTQDATQQSRPCADSENPLDTQLDYRDRDPIYSSLAFEQEAYANERRSAYVPKRQPFAWIHYYNIMQYKNG